MFQMLKIQLMLISICFGLIGCMCDTEGLMTEDDLAKVSLKDGVYNGRYTMKDLYRVFKAPFHDTKVVVTIKDGKLYNIDVLDMSLGRFKYKYRYQIMNHPKEMVKQQSVVVDAVSTATLSSFSMMQAVQDAVNKAIIAKKTEVPKGSNENHT